MERISDSDVSVITDITIPALTKFLGQCLVTVLMTVWLSVLCVCVCVHHNTYNVRDCIRRGIRLGSFPLEVYLAL